MDGIKLNEEFGDLFAYNLNVNFQNKVTEIYYGEYITENAAPIKKMIFENVVWQEFSEFDFVNIFNIIVVGNNFEVFFYSYLSYFNTMKNYISEDNVGQ